MTESFIRDGARARATAFGLDSSQGASPGHAHAQRRGRAVAAHDRALDRTRQPGVDPVAGQKQARDRRSRAPGARAGPAPARTSRAARGRPSTRASRPPRASGSASRQLAAASATSSSFVRADDGSRRRSTPATGATAASPNDRALVEHPLHRPPGQADERRVSTGRSNHRFTVTIGERHRASRGRRIAGERRRRRPRTASASANHGTADDRPRRREPLAAAHSTSATRPPSITTARRRVGAHLAAARLDEGARRLRVHRVQRRAAAARSRSRRIGAEHLGQHAHERRRGGLARPAGSARPAPAAPTASRGSRASARSGSASSRPSRPATPRRRGRARERCRCAQADAAGHAAAPTADRARRARPTRRRRRAGAAARAAPGTRARERAPAASTNGTSSDGWTLHVARRRRCARRNANVSR